MYVIDVVFLEFHEIFFKADYACRSFYFSQLCFFLLSFHFHHSFPITCIFDLFIAHTYSLTLALAIRHRFDDDDDGNIGTHDGVATEIEKN